MPSFRISRKFTAFTKTREDNKIKVKEKIRQRKNGRGKMEEREVTNI